MCGYFYMTVTSHLSCSVRIEVPYLSPWITLDKHLNQIQTMVWSKYEGNTTYIASQSERKFPAEQRTARRKTKHHTAKYYRERYWVSRPKTHTHSYQPWLGSQLGRAIARGSRIFTNSTKIHVRWPYHRCIKWLSHWHNDINYVYSKLRRISHSCKTIQNQHGRSPRKTTKLPASRTCLTCDPS